MFVQNDMPLCSPWARKHQIYFSASGGGDARWGDSSTLKLDPDILKQQADWGSFVLLLLVTKGGGEQEHPSREDQVACINAWMRVNSRQVCTQTTLSNRKGKWNCCKEGNIKCGEILEERRGGSIREVYVRVARLASSRPKITNLDFFFNGSKFLRTFM